MECLQFVCGKEGRRHEVFRLGTLNGIDFLEVAADEKTLFVHFIHPLPGEAGGIPASPGLMAAQFRIEGGVRLVHIGITSMVVSGNTATLHLSSYGDFSTYRLAIQESPTRPQPPAGFDPRLSSLEFSFKVDCPNEFDCQGKDVCTDSPVVAPEIDYLARDYQGFRRLMLDRQYALMPTWRETSPADQQIVLTEMLAYLADQLSYAQDAVATEAYLGKAHRRESIRRHARILDYPMHEGCAARAFLFFEIDVALSGDPNGLSIPKRTLVLTGQGNGAARLTTLDYQKALLESPQPLIFETCHALTGHFTHNKISLYTWDDEECCLPKGAMSTTLRNDGTNPLRLKVGDFLLFEEILGSTTGLPEDADKSHRQVVRLTRVTPAVDPLHGTKILEVAWNRVDALTFPLCVTSPVREIDGVETLLETGVARGNIALSDEGLTVTGAEAPLLPAEVPTGEPYRPLLGMSPLCHAIPYNKKASAADCQKVDPAQALAQIELSIGDGITTPEIWTPFRDLLSSGPFDRFFVAEISDARNATLRFGDGISGMAPNQGDQVSATYRLGGGIQGNVGSEALNRVVINVAGITRLRNPLPAVGGIDPQPLEEVRQFAPVAFKTQKRCVTPEDYAARAALHPEVQKANAVLNWTGSWHTVYVAVDRYNDRPVDAEFQADLANYLEPFRMAGHDLEIRPPAHVSLDLALSVCVKPGYFRSAVKLVLLQVLGNRDFRGGRGFFHPDRFSFGQNIFLSQIYQAVMAVSGVESVQVIRFQRYGQSPLGELEAGVLVAAPEEIMRLDNDPNFPENGKLEMEMGGGL